MLDGLPARWRADRQVLADRDRWSAARADEEGSAVLLAADGRYGVSLVGRGEPAAVTALVAGPAPGELVGGRGAGWLSVPRESRPPGSALAALGLVPFSTWDWMATARPPSSAGPEVGVERLDPTADDDAIRACLAEANPGTSADPSAPGEAGWWGVRAGGTLLGVVGAARRAGDPAGADVSWHLHGLGVRHAARGRGLGAALTAAATSAGLRAGADWVSLGLYADNHTARRIYERLGFSTEGRYASYGPVTADRPPR